jgi:hypothetical protein
MDFIIKSSVKSKDIKEHTLFVALQSNTHGVLLSLALIIPLVLLFSN